MESCRTWRPGWRGIAATAVVVGVFLQGWASALQAQTSGEGAGVSAEEAGVRDIRSSHFLIHTDLSAREGRELVQRLETMLRLVSNYFGRPMRGVIECYVVRDLDTFPPTGMDPSGIHGIKTWGGITLMRTVTDGRRYLAKSVVYANSRLEVVQHEAVHAYCHHTFGSIGPVWYSEGMAEMGHYWTEKDSTVRAAPREIQFLRENPPKSLVEVLSPAHASGDSWQNYASRWALCHFLAYNPNYSSRFWALGRGLLLGKEVSFQQTFGSVAQELSFEYLFFLKHMGPGYHVDRCAWDWSKKTGCLSPGRVMTARIEAGRGWQPAGLTIAPGTRYEYAATGNWQIAGTEAVDADGAACGRGRLVGALMKDYRLGPDFELGAAGLLHREDGGDLYLRCRNAWNELAEDSGRVNVQFKIQGQGRSLGTDMTSERVAGAPLRN